MYKYLRGSRDSREIVEFDISKRGQYITTCVVDVDLLLCGILSFPCGNGDDVTLTGQRQLDILELVQAEREKITSGIEVKTMESWYGSGLNFDDYCFPGDTVGEDIVDYFVNVVSPVTLRYDCMQAGEEHSCEPDGSGKYRATYTTFHRTGDVRFRFDGYCFKGENQNRVEKTYSQQRFEKRLAEAREEAALDGDLR